MPVIPMWIHFVAMFGIAAFAVGCGGREARLAASGYLMTNLTLFGFGAGEPSSPVELEVAVYALEAAGFRCIPASEGQTALEMARSERPSLITLDLDLPDTYGHAVLHGLKGDEATRDIPVVVVSAFADRLPRADLPVVAALLAKPVDIVALTETVEGALAVAGV